MILLLLYAHTTATVRSVDATKSPQKKAAEDQLEIDDCCWCLVVPNIILFCEDNLIHRFDLLPQHNVVLKIFPLNLIHIMHSSQEVECKQGIIVYLSITYSDCVLSSGTSSADCTSSVLYKHSSKIHRFHIVRPTAILYRLWWTHHNISLVVATTFGKHLWFT